MAPAILHGRLSMQVHHRHSLVQTPRQRIRSRRSRWPCCAAARDAPEETDPFVVLGVPRSASRAEMRAAYYARLQDIHPDVSGRDSTAEAVQLNLAYSQLLGGLRSRSYDAEEKENERPSVFDAPEAEPTCIFVNPFACGISPLDWRDLQDLVRDVKEPEAALQAAGLYFSYDAAVCWVTPRQLAVLTEELEAMEQNLSYELTAYYVQDCLLRARFANDRVTYTRTERGVEVDI